MKSNKRNVWPEYSEFMKMESYILLSLALAFTVTFCGAQVPQRCNAPHQLTFKSVTFNHALSEFRDYTGQYDFKSKRLAFRGETYYKKHDRPHNIIMLYKEKVIYETDHDGKTCHKFPFTKFYPFGVPEGAKFEDAYELGGPGESVEVEEWAEPHLFGGKFWVGVFTRKHCYPVRTFLLMNHRNQSTSILYSNVVEGLVNPDWFIPPESCRNATWGI